MESLSEQHIAHLLWDAASYRPFSPDGWFRTGDRARVDPVDGSLNLAGRLKDVFNINGVKHSCADVQTTLERAASSRSHLAAVDRIIAFPSRGAGAHTEQVMVAFVVRKEGIQH